MWTPPNDACHGQQAFVFFNADDDAHGYLPLYLHVTAEDGRQRLLATLRRSGKCGASLGLFGPTAQKGGLRGS